MVENATCGKLIKSSPLPEYSRKTYIWALEEGRRPCLVQVEQFPHLRIEVGVGKAICRELVFEEVRDDFFSERDGVYHYQYSLLNNFVCPHTTYSRTSRAT